MGELSGRAQWETFDGGTFPRVQSLATAHDMTDEDLQAMLNRYTPELPHLHRAQLASPMARHSRTPASPAHQAPAQSQRPFSALLLSPTPLGTRLSPLPSRYVSPAARDSQGRLGTEGKVG
jgi:hypothetical protein